MADFWTGIAFVLIAGLFQASFAAFMKWMGKWKWENFWIIFSTISLFIFPLAWSYVAVPETFSIISASPSSSLHYAMLFGFIWGIGGVFFGLSAIRIGLSLTYSIVIGLTMTIGTVIPLLLGQLPSSTSLYILFGGMAAVLASVAISAYAGSSRERRKGKFGTGLVIAIISGLGSPMLNVGFVFGSGISDTARAIGVSAADSTLPIWVVTLFAGYIVNLAYASYLLIKNRTYKLYASESPKKFALPLVSGLIWFGAFGLYGFATVLLGSLGVSIGWAILMSSMIAISNVIGIATGEWRNNRSALRTQILSIVVVLAGISMMGYALLIG